MAAPPDEATREFLDVRWENDGDGCAIVPFVAKKVSLLRLVGSPVMVSSVI